MVPLPERGVSLNAASVHGTVAIVRNYFYVLNNDDRRDKVQLNFSFFFPFFRELLKTRELKEGAKRREHVANTKKLFSRVPKVFLLFFSLVTSSPLFK